MHYREIEREERFARYNKEKEHKYKQMLEDWYLTEKEFEERKLYQLQKIAKKKEKLPQMIEDDFNYDSAEEKKKKKQDPAHYKYQKGKLGYHILYISVEMF